MNRSLKLDSIIVMVLFVLAVALLVIAIVTKRALKNKKRNSPCGKNCSSCPMSISCQTPKKSFEVKKDNSWNTFQNR